jgi:hypothetical protein
MVDQTKLLAAVGASLSADGQVSELQFVRTDGSTAYIQFPIAASAGVLLSIEQALGQLFEKQQAMLKGKDLRTFLEIKTKRVASVQGAVVQNVPVVSFTLHSNLRVDLALDPTLVRELAEWLRRLEASLDEPPPVRN